MEHDRFHVPYLSDKIPEAVFHGQAVILEPLLQAVGRHSKPFGDLFNRVALLRHLPNRFPLELVRVSLLSPINTPEICLILGFQKCLRKSGQSRGMPVESMASAFFLAACCCLSCRSAFASRASYE